ncbi:MAG: peptidase M16 [Clostridiales bacterium]|nr:MAG: peptidase M16 [Clostridiales bacterium]
MKIKENVLLYKMKFFGGNNMGNIDIRTLDCGIRVVMEELDHVKSAAFGIWVKNGAVNETPSVAGISHFIEHMMFKGTEKRSSRKIAEDVDKIGGQMNAFTGKEATCYYVKTISSHLKDGAEVIIDMVNDAVFDSREMTKERQVICEEIKMIQDQPDDLVHDSITELVFKDSPLGNLIIGTKTSLSRITRPVIVDYKENAYSRDSIVISVAGSFDKDDFCAYLSDKFNKLKESRALEIHEEKPYVPGFKVIKKDIKQSHICMAVRSISIDSPMYYDFAVLNNVMGGSMSSRFFQNIREEKGLAYSVYSTNSTFSTDGYYNIYAGVSHDKIGMAIDGIKEELDILDKKGLTEEEILMSKEQLKSSYIFGQENVASRMFNIGKNLLLLGKVYEQDEVIEGIEKVSKESIDDAKKLICNIENYSAVCLTDKDINLKKLVRA